MLPPDSSRRAARQMRAGRLALRAGIDVGHPPANGNTLANPNLNLRAKNSLEYENPPFSCDPIDDSRPS
jgi:hypothetical protein